MLYRWLSIFHYYGQRTMVETVLINCIIPVYVTDNDHVDVHLLFTHGCCAVVEWIPSLLKLSGAEYLE